MSTTLEQLKVLLAPDSGCGPVSATVRVGRRHGCLEINAEVEHPIAALPQPDAPLRAAAIDLTIRVEGPVTREFHAAYYALLIRERPMLQFWGAPRVELDPNSYTSSQCVVDDTHYTFSARIPLSLLGLTEGKLGCNATLTGYRGGSPLVRFLSTGDGPRLPGWEGENGFALFEDEVKFDLGRLEQLIIPRATACLKTDAEIGLDQLPSVRQVTPVTTGSERLALDGDWRFNGSPGGPEEPADAWQTWPIIRLPGHHALQNLVVDEPRGVARWVREVHVPASFVRRRLLLRLDSVEGEARVAINGLEIAVIDSPYLPNQLDVTAALRPGEINRVQVTASRRGNLNAATSRAGTSLFPDITGRVWLEALPATWLENLVCDTDADGGLQLSWQLVGQGAGLQLAGRLFAADGTIVWQVNVPAPDGRLAANIADVRQWHPEHPHLYTLELELWRDRTRIAKYALRIGFRSAQVAPGKLLLNGKSLTVYGSNHHPQQPLTGQWMREDEHRADVALYRDANVNCLRVWPVNEAFLDACDELGVMVQMEVPISFFNFHGNEFNPEDNAARKRNRAVRDANVERTIRFLHQYRNHPCICLWSVGNESDWDDGFEASARVIKRLDPHRPVLASQDDNRGMGLPALDLDTEHYPFFRYRTAVAGVGTRPILHTEWCHLSCRNVGELAIDPGLHDRYVDALRRMMAHTRDNKSGCIGGHIFTGMDVAAYAYPPGYPADPDHVPCLGFIDRWRRPTPEYHHVWKLYSPIELQRIGELVFRVENRSASAPLNSYRFTTPAGSATLRTNGELHVTGNLPLELSCWDAAGRLVNRWHYPAPAGPKPAVRETTLRATKEGEDLLIEHGDLRWRIRPDELPVARRGDGERAAWDIGRLVVTPSAENPPSGLAQQWRGTGSRLESAFDTEIVVVLRGRYANAEGGYRFRFLADGRVIIGYRFQWQGTAFRVRELGVAFRLPRGCDRLSWERDAEWSWYPADHIGRPVGTTGPFPDPRAVKAGLWDVPTWPWAHDATAAGCKDFRSTKRAIRRYALTAPGGAGLEFAAAGDLHARAWVAADHIGAQIGHFTGRSAELFIAGVDLADLRVEKGTVIESEVICRIR